MMSGSAFHVRTHARIITIMQCRDECEAFCKRAVSHAMARDGSSGGVIRTITISKEGVSRQIFTDEQVQQHYGEMSMPGDAMTAM